MNEKPDTDCNHNVSFKEFVNIVNERERKFEQRFIVLEKVIDRLIDMQNEFARKAEVTAALVASDKAIAKAEASIEKRLENVNEFRATLSDQQSTLARKSEVDIRFETIKRDLDMLTQQVSQGHARSSGSSAAWAIVVVVVTLVLSAIGVIAAVVTRP